MKIVESRLQYITHDSHTTTVVPDNLNTTFHLTTYSRDILLGAFIHGLKTAQMFGSNGTANLDSCKKTPLVIKLLKASGQLS